MQHQQGQGPVVPSLGQWPVPMRPMAPVIKASNGSNHMVRGGAMPIVNGTHRGSKPVGQMKTTQRQRNTSNRDAQVKRKGSGRGTFQKYSKKVMVSGKSGNAKVSPAQKGEIASVKSRLRIPKWPYGGLVCIDREEIEQRYGSNLVLPEDFVQMTHCWIKNKSNDKIPFEKVGVKRLCQLIDINRALMAHHEVKIKEMKRPTLSFLKDSGDSSDAVSSSYVSKVILCTGLNQDQKIAVLSVPGEADSQGGEWDHLSKLLKFVCARREVDGEKSGIFALGGVVSPEIDGTISVDDQDVEDSPVMRRAAIRHVKDQTGVDLSECKEWIPFVKLKYLRPRVKGKEFEEIVTLVFMVLDADQAVPGGLRAPIDDPKWQHAWKTRHDERHYSEPGILEKSSAQEEYEDGELNMDEINREELIAEAAQIPCPSPRLLFMGAHTENIKFKTMSLSLDGLLDYNETDTENETFELSIFAEAFHEMLSRDAGDVILKVLMKCSNIQKLGVSACANYDGVDASEENLSIGEYSSNHSLNSGDEEPVENELALLAFGYFDVSGRGYLTVADASKILNRLGRGLHKQTLNDMLDKLAVKSDGVESPRLYYHDLLE